VNESLKVKKGEKENLEVSLRLPENTLQCGRVERIKVLNNSRQALQGESGYKLRNGEKNMPPRSGRSEDKTRHT